jgi:NADPH-dependent 2,4-dienoyl-CoA reductase/sulfur reductase-like enzyme
MMGVDTRRRNEVGGHDPGSFSRRNDRYRAGRHCRRVRRMNTYDFEVIVVGAGPVGFTLAIDLGRRGVRTLLIEKDPTTKA